MFSWIPAAVNSLERVSLVLLISLTSALTLYLFLPDNLSAKIGIGELKRTTEPYTGILWLIFVSLLVARIFGAGTSAIKKARKRKQTAENRIEALRSLSAQEKGYLQVYINNGETTICVGLDDGVMGGLVAQKICYRSGNMFSLTEGMAHNLQPWAREILQNDPGLLDGGCGSPMTPSQKLRSRW
ncbi:MAG: super-infection exclusion protein B [Pseudomonadota bacterium]